jgi:hypothetical protein
VMLLNRGTDSVSAAFEPPAGRVRDTQTLREGTRELGAVAAARLRRGRRVAAHHGCPPVARVFRRESSTKAVCVNSGRPRCNISRDCTVHSDRSYPTRTGLRCSSRTCARPFRTASARAAGTVEVPATKGSRCTARGGDCDADRRGQSLGRARVQREASRARGRGEVRGPRREMMMGECPRAPVARDLPSLRQGKR